MGATMTPGKLRLLPPATGSSSSRLLGLLRLLRLPGQDEQLGPRPGRRFEPSCPCCPVQSRALLRREANTQDIAPRLTGRLFRSRHYVVLVGERSREKVNGCCRCTDL